MSMVMVYRSRAGVLCGVDRAKMDEGHDGDVDWVRARERVREVDPGFVMFTSRAAADADRGEGAIVWGAPLYRER